MITDFKLFEDNNPKLLEYYLNESISKIESYITKNNIEIIKKERNNYPIKMNTAIGYEYEIWSKEKIDSDKIKNYIDNLSKKYLRLNIILSHYLHGIAGSIKHFRLKICMKSIKIERVKPDEFVYHTSLSKNRKSILKNGLIPKTNEKWGEDLAYPPAIFAIREGFQYWRSEIGSEKDVWKIDTSNLPNQWWIDLNINDGHAIMTFDPIPPKYLELIKSF